MKGDFIEKKGMIIGYALLVNASVEIGDEVMFGHEGINFPRPIAEDMELLCRGVKFDASESQVHDFLNLITRRF